MKINNINLKFFETDKILKIRRSPIAGVIKKFIVIGLALATIGLFNQFKSQDSDLGVFTPESEIGMDYEKSIEIGIDQINSLNVIINDLNCSDSFISSIADALKEESIDVTWTSDLSEINTDNSVVITLDQQYISGPGIVIIAPYENGRKDKSDALAIASQVSFKEVGFFADEIQCGKTGYEQLEDGTVIEMIKSDTEKNVDESTSFVEICFGTQNTNPQLVAKAIKNSLVRYANHIINEVNNDDLLYRTEVGETVEDVVEKIGIAKTYSNEDYEFVPNNTVFINSSVMLFDSFDKKIPVNVSNIESTICHKK